MADDTLTAPDPMATLTPPAPAHDGEPQVTVEDPSAGGYYCGRRRSPKQIQQAVDAGNDSPWPWCRMRAGWGTDHRGAGGCKQHGGATPNERKSHQLRYAEAQAAVFGVFAQIMADPSAPPHARLRAAENLADRGGMPRRQEVNVEDSTQTLLERVEALQVSQAASS